MRATTDCIARGIAASPTALGYARQENWLEAIKNMPEECNHLGNRLVTEHDRLFGAGTGKAFVEGPYASDLPRAIKARIGAEIERQAATLVQGEEAPVSTAIETEVQVPPPAVPPPAPAAITGKLTFDVEAGEDEAKGDSAGRNTSPDPGVGTAVEEHKAAAVSVAPRAGKPPLDRPVIPRVFLIICVIALAASLYAAVRGLAWRPTRLAETI